MDNDQVEHQNKKKEIKPRSNWNKKSASPYCESLTARMQPADFGDPKLFKVVYMLFKILLEEFYTLRIRIPFKSYIS